MTAETESILEALGTARRFADPDAPQEARLMAARGALPLPPPQIASVLFALTHDPDPEVKELAGTSLDNLPSPMLDATLAADVHPALLGYMATKLQEDETQLEKIAINAATSDETFCFLASRPFVRIIDIAAHNQVRLLRCPELVETLGENPLTGQATIDRILHFLGVERGDLEEPVVPTADVPTPPPRPTSTPRKRCWTSTIRTICLRSSPSRARRTRSRPARRARAKSACKVSRC